ncbi:BrnT family toxin [Aminobacter sp. Piv2-1]|uniref:BrnT family toxin n=1 Tax=Aminobacter sp. Piv2-1 TaxID=3031122 RepID=UPI0030968AD3
MRIDGFDWDDGNWPKCAKHGLSKAQIESVFDGELDIFDDPFDSDEHRFRAIGRDGQGQHIFIVFCIRELRGLELLRPISARYMHAREIRHYEQQKA